MKIICLSDTHGFHRSINLPYNLIRGKSRADLILFAGDFSNTGELEIIQDFDDWIGALGIPCIGIAGNHDLTLERLDGHQLFKYMTYLCDEEITYKGLKIFGTPKSVKFGNWAFMQTREEGKRFWENVPGNLDILLTHGPACSLLSKNYKGTDCGCPGLRDYLKREKPRLHVFGHIHESFGVLHRDGIVSVNAAYCGYPKLEKFNRYQVIEL